MDKKTLKTIIISVIIIAVVLLICIFILKINSKKEETYLKNYKVNEYIPTYVSTEDLVQIYLNDYLYNMRYNKEYAYSLLDNEYKNKKFKSFDNYSKYINSLASKDIVATKYLEYNKSGYTFFEVYDQENNVYIFKTKGIMQYSVFLDNKTVEIR